jgi:microcompartment protein CcmL/EutN
MTGPFLRRQGEGARVGADATTPADALALVEVSSIARGHVVADLMCKKAPIELVLARPISPGKHLTLIIGAVADVREAMLAGTEAADDTFVDKLELAQVAPALIDALRSTFERADGRSLGLFETFSVASSLLAADAACKAAEVSLVALRLGDGIGGKAYFTLQGEQADVEAGLFAAETITQPALFAGRELIPRPHDDLVAELARDAG